MKRFAGKNLEPLQIDAVLSIKLDVTSREIVADDANQSDGAKEARGDRGVTGGTAQQTRILCVWCLDGVQRGGADNQYAHFNSKFRGRFCIDGSVAAETNRSLNFRPVLTTSRAFRIAETTQMRRAPAARTSS